VDENKKVEGTERQSPAVGVDKAPPSSQKAALEYSFVLPCGLLLEDGTVLKDIKLTPLTGRDRKLLFEPKFQQNQAAMTTELIKQRLIGIGPDYRPIATGEIRKLLVGDRDFILLKLSQITHGDKLLARTRCPTCGVELDIEVDINSLPIKEMTEEEQRSIRDGRRVFKFSRPELRIVECTLMWPDGEMQEKLARRKSGNIAEGFNFLISQMMMSFNNGPPLTFYQVEDLPLPVLEAFDDATVEYRRGPDLMPTMSCEACGSETVVSLDILSFFFRGAQERRKREREETTRLTE